MGILIILTAATLLGLIFLDDMKPLAAIIGGAIIIVVAGAMINTTVEGKTNMEIYKQDAIRIELAARPGTTIVERTAAIELAMKHNAIITETKLWSKNFFLWGLYYAPVGELPMFDISKIDAGSIRIEK